MDQIANLVIDLGIDAAEFKNEIPRIKNLLNGAASDAERSSARMQRFMERQTQAARQTTQAASSAATAASVHAQTVEKNAQAHERMAREVEKTRQRMEALSQKMREEQAQAMALAEAQDKAAAAFYRQIDSVKQASAGLQELQRIQQQIRQARNSGGIGQQDYLALISEVTAKTRVLTQAEEEATRQKVAFIRQLKEQAAGIATDRMTEAHKQLLALQQRISDLDGKKLTADEKSVLARKDELIQALTLLDVKQQELQKQTALNDLKKKTIQLTSQLAEEERAQRQQHDLDIATVGMGDQQRQRYQVQLSLRQKYQQQLEQLRRDSEQKGTYNTDDYRKAEQALTESLNRQLNENRRYWQQLEIAQGDWKNGILRALQNVTEKADNTAGTVEQLFTSAFSSMSDWLATFCTTGKLNFKSFTSSVLSDMSRIMAQIALMKAVKGIASALPFDFVANADGGVYQSADLSRYSGTVVNRPTFFAFAKGAGVMGEAGPEAILPLRRGADGKLGVVADIGGSGMAMFAPQYNIEINNDGTNGQIGPAALKVVYDLGKKAAADFMQQQARDGGRLSGAYR